jgi:putative aminopeptidase FrvX
MKTESFGLLEQLLAIPTMSFHEEGIATFVRWYALGLGLSVEEDRYGNILVYKGKKPAGVVFNAHMDHPGFEVVSSKNGSATVALWGKVDSKIFAGSKAVVYSDSGSHGVRIGRAIAGKKHEGRPVFRVRSKVELSKGDFGHFDLPSMRVAGDRIYTRAADNLMGVASILDMFTRLGRTESGFRATGLFTRGEEAGFLGAIAAMEEGTVSQENPLIVLECSSASHAKVVIGEGPVIRVGDWQSSYDPTIDRWVADVAQSMEGKRRGGFRYQREILTGGRCEACMYIASGYRTGGIALPLGNYHNHGRTGPAAEYVSISDYDGMVDLMCGLAGTSLPGKDYLRKRVRPIYKNYRSLRNKLLKSK